MSGQQIGAVVGGIIGAFFGMPQLGAAIGGMIGGWIAPTQVNGPHIGDGAAQNSAEGQPIAWILGTAGWVQGNIIQISPRREVKKTDDGKGSGTEVNTFEAHQDFCILVCESSEHRDSIMAGVLIVKVDGKIVYDMRPDKNFGAENAKFLRNHTFYDGNESQMPDPTMEAIVGVDNALAYRGVFTMVARDINLTQYGDRIPTYEFVMVGAGAEIQTETTTFVAPHYAGFTNTPWPLAEDLSSYQFQAMWMDPSFAGATSPVFESRQECDEWFQTTFGVPAPTIYIGYSANSDGTAGDYTTGNNGVGNPVTVSAFEAQSDVTDLTAITLMYQFYAPVGFQASAPSASCMIAEEGDWIGISNGSIVRRVAVVPPSLLAFENCGDGFFSAGYYPYCIKVIRGAAPPQAISGDPCLLGAPVTLPDSDEFLIDCAGNITPRPVYSTQSGSFYALQAEVITTLDPYTYYDKYTLGPILESADPAGTEAFWTAAYDAAVLEGTMEPGLAYGVGYPALISETHVATITATELTQGMLSVAAAITRIAERGGLTAADIDVSEMEDLELQGYPIMQSYNAADCIRPLMTAFTSYCSEYDGKMRLHEHGEEIEIVVDPQDFIEGSETDKDTREQAIEYPRLISVTAIDPTQDYVARPQTERRITPDVRAIGEEQMQIPIVLLPDHHRQLAAIAMKVSWARAQGEREFSLPYVQGDEYLHLVAGKPFALEGKRYIAAEYGLEDGEIKVRAKYDRQSAYTSNVTATPALPPTAPPSGIGGVTLFAGMNLPRLRTKDNTPGMYLAVAGLLESWPGCLLQMSIDDEATWTTAISSMTQSSAMGYLTAPIDDQPTSTLFVAIHGGELNSITDAQFTDGGNPSAVLTNEVAEILQFKTADEIDPGEYELTELGRGRLGTAAAAHLQGDRIVQLEDVYFLPLDITLSGRKIKFRPVTFGTAPDNNAVYEVTFLPQFTGPQIVEAYVNDVGEQYTNESGSVYYKVIS